MIRKIRRILLYIIGIIVVLLGLLIALTLIFRDDITVLFLSELNKRLQTEIHVKKTDFSLIRKFPYASIEFREISSRSSKNFKHENGKFTGDTLFNFKSLFLEFSLYDLLSKNYKISKVHAVGGSLNIARDKSGNFNYLIWKTSAVTDTGKFEVKLQNIRLSNVQLTYSDYKDPKRFSVLMNNCQIRCSLSSELYDFTSRFDGKILNFDLDGLNLFSQNPLNGAINLSYTSERFKLGSAILKIDQNDYIIDGIYNFRNTEKNVFHFKSNKINLENSMHLLPEKLRVPLEKYNIKGTISINSSISFINLNRPVLEINFAPVKSSLSIDYNKIKLTGLDLNGRIFIQNSDSIRLTKITLNHINGKIDSDPFEGAVNISKSRSATFSILWKGKSSMATLNKLIQNDTLKFFTGNYKGQLEIKGRVVKWDSLGKYDFAHFDYSGEIFLDKINILKPEILLGISEISGKFRIDKDIIVENSAILYKENRLSGTGKITNFLPWLLTSKETLKIQGDIQSTEFNLDKVIAKGTSSKSDSLVTHFPDYLILSVDVKFREFHSGKFSASNVAGKITYRPKLFDLRSLYFETMEGNLTGSALLLQKPDSRFIFRTQVLLDKINISTLFSTFNNFGQSLIDYKNIKGKISGLTNFSSEWTNSFSILSPTVLVDGTMKIENGELIEYEPLNGLSRYINVEELKHIYFSTLQNDIFIRNRVITIPQMDIKSTNFDVIGSGTHDFDNNFNYKIKVMLSETLYKKAKKSKNQMDEFGVLEPESTRKISLPLTIKGNINDYKVSYDAKQAAVNMIQNLKNEKKKLRSILKDEFGLFKKDSTNNAVKEEKKNNNAVIEFDNDNYQSGKKTDPQTKSKSLKQKDSKAKKDTTRLKVDFQ